MLRVIFLLLILTGVFTACETIEDEGLVRTGVEEFLPPADTLFFTVDSIVYDRAASGVIRDTSATVWRARPIATYTTERERRYVVDIMRDGNRLGGFMWQWTVDGTGLSHQIHNLRYLCLPENYSTGMRWDPLPFGDKDEVISVAGEPIRLYLGSLATVDTLFESYKLSSGDVQPAVRVRLADENNRIELRDITELYARGQGLIEHSSRILNTQRSDSDEAWEVKAEEGYLLSIRRNFN